MSKPRFLVFAGLFSLGVLHLLASCNAVTGASDIVLQGDETPVDPFVNAAGVHIDSIDLYQGVVRPLMAGGVPAAPGVAVVAGRPGMIRVFVTTDADYNNLPVTGRLYINDAEAIIATKTFMGPPAQENLDSTLNFKVPGELFAPDMKYRIELKQDPGAKASTDAWKYPANDTDPIEVKSDGMSLKLLLVPVQYGADGSDRLPNTTPEQLQQYKDAFMGFYPIPSVDIQVRSEPLVWNQSVSPLNGNSWANLLDAVGDLRKQDAAAADQYYFGIFNPADSEGAFCGGGCIAGLANLAGPGDSFLRAGIGLGFGGSISNETAIHEIGHTFGREHSPGCGAAGADPNYPYQKGNTGVWGYDIVKDKLYSPDSADLMSYCLPYWVSDYTFTKFFERFVIVNKAAKMHYPAELVNRVYARVRISEDGTLLRRPSVQLETPPVGHTTKEITVMTTTGPRIVTGQYYPYDHIEGGELVWLPPNETTSSITVEFKGKARTLFE